jgi:hypothetical protein
MKRSPLIAALFLALVATACHRQSSSAIAHRLVGDDSAELRTAFNADVDKVRVIMLVSPS